MAGGRWKVEFGSGWFLQHLSGTFDTMPIPSKNPSQRRQFTSDNNSGICPEVWTALQEANQGHVAAYGNDPWTAKACKLLCDLFETDCKVFFVLNGTAANALAIASLCDSFHSIICHEYAHVETDECGAPGFFSRGAMLASVVGENGKITPAKIEQVVQRRNDVHAPKPKVVTLSQATELGTVYSPHELTAIGKLAHKMDLHVHMDGARFANAVAELGVAPREISWEAGVDILCLGGTKNGMALGEAVIFFNRDLAKDFDRRRKQGGQLSSKMRFLAAQWVGLLERGTWLRYATRANQIARELEKKLRRIPSLRMIFPRQANSVFVEMPSSVVDGLRQRGWRFYTDVGPGAVRLMCSWDSTEEDIAALIQDILDLSGGIRVEAGFKPASTK